MGRVSIVLVAAILLAVPVTAQEGPKKGRPAGAAGSGSKSAPPGWSRGLKTGWGGQTLPPGAREWSANRKREFKKDLEGALAKIRERAGGTEGFTEPDLQSALLSLEAMAGKGVPVDEGLLLVERLMDGGMKGRGIESVTRAMAFGVEEGFQAGRINA